MNWYALARRGKTPWIGMRLHAEEKAGIGMRLCAEERAEIGMRLRAEEKGMDWNALAR